MVAGADAEAAATNGSGVRAGEGAAAAEYPAEAVAAAVGRAASSSRGVRVTFVCTQAPAANAAAHTSRRKKRRTTIPAESRDPR